MQRFGHPHCEHTIGERELVGGHSSKTTKNTSKREKGF